MTKPTVDPLATDQESIGIAEQDVKHAMGLFHKALDEFNESYRKLHTLKQEGEALNRIRSFMTEKIDDMSEERKTEKIKEGLEHVLTLIELASVQKRVEELSRRICILWIIINERKEEVWDEGVRRFTTGKRPD